MRHGVEVRLLAHVVRPEDRAECLERRLVAERRRDRSRRELRARDRRAGNSADRDPSNSPSRQNSLQQRLVLPQRGQVGDDRLVRDDEVAVVRGALDRGLDALLEVGDQVSGVAAEDLVSALSAEHHLDVLRGELRDHVLRERARAGDGIIEVVDEIGQVRADVLGRDRDLEQLELATRSRDHGRSGSRRTPAPYVEAAREALEGIAGLAGGEAATMLESRPPQT